MARPEALCIAPPTFAMKWLMPRLPGFQVLHAQLELHINTNVQPVDV
ncbi:hypothetical protein QTI24_24720 [Variovorax sp. J22P240]|nr:hypothetical protein [Variovorax sp. J22P240]MDM0001835.1 hypothetical protein [Variovorax sp. J22P240]